MPLDLTKKQVILTLVVSKFEGLPGGYSLTFTYTSADKKSNKVEEAEFLMPEIFARMLRDTAVRLNDPGRA